MQTTRGICIHSHLYQPPREDPWLDAVLKDASAAPQHDWNARVHAECYRPNAAARLVDARGRIVSITNNYRQMSFNIGPTLHGWIATHDQALADAVLRADRDAIEGTGQGNAIAQSYNHTILPLSEERDIRTQVFWGISDFIHRFGRRPRGMWLPETAVDNRSLETLAACGVEFTILAPHQCAAVKPPDGGWKETPGGTGMDTRRPYLAELPSGATICVVFYYGAIAHDIAFGGLLDNGDTFAEALMRQLDGAEGPALLTIATDGETYGHHHRYGEMALARATQRISDSPDMMLTNIPAFLDHYPPAWRCRVAENTSWSCAHGVERWRSDCGCHTGGEPGWHQAWRAPLRQALDCLRDRIDEIYEKEMRAYCDAPWKLRDEAVSLYQTRPGGEEGTKDLKERKLAFLHARCGDLAAGDAAKALTLIEAQRMRMFMYTSCGWFFNDISGIETQQVLGYAVRAAEMMERTSATQLQDDFLNDLRKARGNRQDFATGFDVAQKTVLPRRRSIRDIAASSMLMARKKRYYAYRIRSDAREYASAGFDLTIADLKVMDERTLDTWKGAAACISSGGLDDVCRLTERTPPDKTEIRRKFYVSDLISAVKYIDETFEVGQWHFTDVTLDDKERIAAERTKDADRCQLDHAEGLLEDNRRLMVQLHAMDVPPPQFLQAAANLVYRHRIEDIAEATEDALALLESGSELEVLLEEAADLGIAPETSILAPKLEEAFRKRFRSTQSDNETHTWEWLLARWERAKTFGVGIDPWGLQNEIWAILEEGAAAPGVGLLTMANALGFAIPDPRG